MPGLKPAQILVRDGRLAGDQPTDVQAMLDRCDAGLRNLLEVTNIEVGDPRELYCVMVGFLGAHSIFMGATDDRARALSFEVFARALLRRLDGALT